MKRLVIVVAVIAGAALLALGSGSEGESPLTYRVELDSAFGLVEDGDVKVAGVRAGGISAIQLDRQTKRALVDIELTDRAFGELRVDAHCEVRPQSLLGEYFLNCQPGTSPRPIEPGGLVTVEHTSSTIPADLVTNVLRRPYAERLRLVVSSLGAGVAGNGERLNDALRRAVPAIRETNGVLRSLASQERALSTLARDADRVLGRLADERREVGRFIVEAGEAASATAPRDRELAASLRQLPGFLDELSPTMRALDDVARRGVPAAREVRAAAPALHETFAALQPFTKAAAPAVRSLASAARAGRPALAGAAPVVDQLARTTGGAPELLLNLALLLEHLDDRDNAIEPHAKSPGGKGFTGLEGLLRYVRSQTLAINVYDENSHLLKQALIEDPDCIQYTDLETLRSNPAKQQCLSILGPNQPGINSPDSTLPGDARSTQQALDYLLGP